MKKKDLIKASEAGQRPQVEDAELMIEPEPVKLDWHTEQRKVNDLVPYEHNPRQMTAEQMKQLRESLEEFGLVEIPAINLDNILIAGHQRCKGMQLLGQGEDLIDVRVPNRMLTSRELKRYNVASNAIKGNWLDEILKAHFQEADIEEYGLKFAEVDEMLKENQVKEVAPEYPIVAKFSEQYEAFVIVSSNEIDANFIKQVLGFGSQMQSYKKESEIGGTFVIDAKKFGELWKSRS